MWNGNNPEAYSDPTGFLTQAQETQIGAWMAGQPNQILESCSTYVEDAYKGALDINLHELIVSDYWQHVFEMNGYNMHGLFSNKPDLDTENMHHYFAIHDELRQFTGGGMHVGDIIFVNFGGHEDHVAIVGAVEHGVPTSVYESQGINPNSGTIRKSWSNFQHSVRAEGGTLDSYARVTLVNGSGSKNYFGNGDPFNGGGSKDNAQPLLTDASQL